MNASEAKRITNANKKVSNLKDVYTLIDLAARNGYDYCEMPFGILKEDEETLLSQGYRISGDITKNFNVYW